jgi:hypothetical protein
MSTAPKRRPDDLKTILWAALLVTLCLAPLLSPGALWGQSDLTDIYFPARAFLHNSLLNGHYPLWNPYLGIGMPVQTGIRPPSNPFLLATCWLPTDLHVKLSLWLHTLFSVSLTACFLKRRGLSRPAALCAGLAYGVGSFPINRMYAGHLDWIEVLPSLPLMLWCSLNAVSRRGVAWTLIWGTSIAFSAMCGQYQCVYLGCLSILIFQLALLLGGSFCRIAPLDWKAPWSQESQTRPLLAPHDLLAPGVPLRERLGDLIQLALRWMMAGLAALGLIAFQVLPGLQTLANTDRLSGAFLNNSSPVPPLFWMTTLLPRFFDGGKTVYSWSSWYSSEAQAYLGIPALGLMALGLSRAPRRWLVPALVAAFGAWISLGPGSGLYDLVRAIDPFFMRNFRGACRFSIMFVFYAGWLAGLGLDRLKGGRSWLALLFPGLPLLAILLWLNYGVEHPDVWRQFLVAHSLPETWPAFSNPQAESAGFLLEREWGDCLWACLLCLLTAGLGLVPLRFRGCLAVALLSLDLGVLARHYLVVVPSAAFNLPPETATVLRQQLGSGRVMWDPQLGLVGHGMIESFTEISSYESFGIPALVWSKNLAENRPIEQPGLLLQPWSNHPLWDLEGVSVVVNDRPEPPWPGLLPLAPGIYRNPKAFPRIYMTGQTRWQPDRKESVRWLVAHAAAAADCTLVNSPAPPPSAPRNPVFQLKSIEIQPNRVLASVSQDGDGMLVLTDAWWPGWRVRVDGLEQTLYCVNGGLHRGVWLQSGDHQVEFFYWPASLARGLLISLSAALGLGLWLGYAKFRACTFHVKHSPARPPSSPSE